MKFLRKSFFWLIGILAGLILLLTLAGFFYADEAKAYLVTQLNARLSTRLDAKNIDFSVWKNFPSASITFSDVTLFGNTGNAGDESDTLLKAEELYFSMSLMDLISKNYNITTIAGTDGFIRIKTDKDGRGNYNILKPSNDSTTTDIGLEEILLSHMVVSYEEADATFIRFSVNRAEAEGDLSSDRFTLSTTLEGTADTLVIAGASYPLNHRKTTIQSDLDINKVLETVSFNNSSLRIAEMQFAASGKIKTSNPVSLDIEAAGKGLDIKSFLSILPEKYLERTRRYESSGEFYFNARINGKAGDKHVPLVTADFGIAGGEISYDGNTPLEEVSLQGTFTNKGVPGNQEMILSISNFTGKMAGSTLQADLSVENFSSPHINLNTNSTIDLSELRTLFPSDSLPELSGKAVIKAKFDGTIKNPSQYTLEDFKRCETSGELSLEEVSVTPSSGLPFTQLQGDFLFDNNDIIVNRLDGKLGNSDFAIQGFFRNIISWFFIPDNKLIVDAKFKSQHINLDELLAGNEPSGARDFSLKFTDAAGFYLNADIASLTYRKFQAENLSGKILLRERKFRSEQLSFEAFGGSFKAAGSVDATDPADFLISCNMQARQANIQKMFEGCENFGQEVLRSEHLKGTADIDLIFTAAADSTLILRSDEVYAATDIAITQGELIGFEPLKALGRFVEIEELDHVKFGVLSNHIEIKNRQVLIPKMQISSSALDLDLSGTHGFNDVIDYRIRVLLSDILSTKAKKAKKQNEEYGIYELEEKNRGRMSLFIAMTGTVDNPKFSYDKIGMKDKIKGDVKDEQRTVKTLLNKEFGIFSKDTTLLPPTKEQPVEFKIEFDGKETDQEEKEVDPDRFKTRESRFKKWLKKLPGEEISPEEEKAP